MSSVSLMRFVYSLYCALSFILLFLLLFPFFLIFGLTGRRKAIWHIIRCWSIIWLGMTGMRTRVSYATPGIFQQRSGHIIVSNHQSYLDVALIFRAIPVMCRPLAKYELARVPLFGYLYRQMAVLVDRSNAASKRKSIMDLKKIIRKGENIFIFPEGTFNETDATLIPFYDGAFKIALETGTDIIPVLFPDTADRFHYSGLWKWSPGINRVIVLDPVHVADYAPSEIRRLKKDVFNRMSEAMHRCRPHLKKAVME
ncbi:MAG: hypothetical protein BGO09_08585 [Bacteroidetes bacterium 47-18]|nr:MAG: hypothetical protein BGO09_08585 [Bacteroidetes bacterium 47-18]